MRLFTEQTLVSRVSETASGDTKLTPLADAGRYYEGHFFIYCSAASGTSPTLDVDLITYCQVTGQWHVLDSFTQIVAATAKEMFTIPSSTKPFGIGRVLATQWVIGGSDTPTFSFVVGAILKD